ncbi:hypothetical protein HZS_6546 [Henneguya salminicola]|nr:hypothetical protein HZS_6546 [Henneguya salminicola]
MTEYILEKDFKEIYEMGPQIGKGLFGNIKLAFNKNSNLKTISKDLLIKYKKESCALREKKALTRVFKHPLFAQLFDYRQTEHHICILYQVHIIDFELSYECRHDITPYIEKLGGFCKETAKFYSAEVACAIEYLHILGIAHRNIKPENVLVKENLHICLTDFKSCMYLNGMFVFNRMQTVNMHI